MSESSAGKPLSAPASPLAILSLILSFTGLTILPFVGSVAAVVTGRIARREIRAARGTAGGEGLALAGEILGWVGIGITVVVFCVGGVLLLVPSCAALFFAADSLFRSGLPALLGAV